ncbi:LytR/AlgR family response regulator transcription factor [Paenisporosarcina cavernae]|uniref:DNA-binding response regulator n=1 Tax=Paenisporosarcina cavernae TaxID=2320858 RepID=A0A385YY27_9BACL|nr:LytTR family DNA-binding domain-containing protein [Paenisporosarcina cavernae]AYC30518.1 DNA-binding response regulator [Paenisporosarcina cavernae]
MNRIRALVVDDERYAREELIFLLKKHPAIHVIGEAESGDQAIMKAIQLQPDVVFLDVEMPKLSGMEVAKALVELKKVPFIIFATAYPQFAANAFRMNAVDYLLKPYDEDQLSQAIHRVEERLSRHVKQESNYLLGKLPVDQDGEIHYVDIDSILYLCREENVTKIVTEEADYDVRTPLKDLETRLSTYSFFRIHKSYLVNLHYITRLTPWFNGAYHLELHGRTEKLSVSRNYVKQLRERLEM